MIYLKTKLKTIPETCTKCKFSGSKYVDGDFFFDSVRIKICTITNTKVPYVFNKSKNNWEYVKCKNCPIVELDNVE